MKSLGFWLVKAILSAIYWFGCLYVATGLFFGDRVTPDGIAPSATRVPPWLFALAALALYVLLLMIWDRLVARRFDGR